MARRKSIGGKRPAWREQNIKDSAAALSIPDEVLHRCTMLTVLGRQEVTIEGHEGIVAYETDCIRVRTDKTVIGVKGSRLIIDYYNDEELKIVGCIEQIFWENR